MEPLPGGGQPVDLTDIPMACDAASLLAGVPVRTVETLVAKGFLTRGMVRSIIADRTLERRRQQDQPLTLAEADGILRLVRVRRHAISVFEDVDTADAFLSSPNPALGDAVPIRHAVSDVGAREVETVLGRIEHGIFA